MGGGDGATCQGLRVAAGRSGRTGGEPPHGHSPSLPVARFCAKPGSYLLSLCPYNPRRQKYYFHFTREEIEVLSRHLIKARSQFVRGTRIGTQVWF